MKKLLLILFVLAGASGFAQLQQHAGQITFAAAIGESPTFNGSAFENYEEYYNFNYTVYDDRPMTAVVLLPYMGAQIDYRIIRKLSVGIETSYQAMDWHTDYWIDRLTRFNISGQVFWHFTPQFSGLDMYMGIRAGFNYLGDTPRLNPNPARVVTGPLAFNYFMATPNQWKGSAQLVLLGAKIYVYKNIGIFGEFGLGFPFLYCGGIAYTINTKKVSN